MRVERVQSAALAYYLYCISYIELAQFCVDDYTTITLLCLKNAKSASKPYSKDKHALN